MILLLSKAFPPRSGQPAVADHGAGAVGPRHGAVLETRVVVPHEITIRAYAVQDAVAAGHDLAELVPAVADHGAGVVRPGGRAVLGAGVLVPHEIPVGTHAVQHAAAGRDQVGALGAAGRMGPST